MKRNKVHCGKDFKPGTGKMRRQRNHNCLQSAFTVLEMLIVITVIVVLAGLFIPASTGNRAKATRIKCACNLKQVGLAFRIWEGDHGDHYPAAVYTNAAGGPLFTNAALAYRYYQVMSNELNNPQVLICPCDTNHVAATNFTTGFSSSNISYYVGLEADERFPQLFLSGDSCLTNHYPLRNGLMRVTPKHPPGWTREWHAGTGNIGLADGSVQMWSTVGLQKYVRETNITERLLMPDGGAAK